MCSPSFLRFVIASSIPTLSADPTDSFHCFIVDGRLLLLLLSRSLPTPYYGRHRTLQWHVWYKASSGFDHGTWRNAQLKPAPAPTPSAACNCRNCLLRNPARISPNKTQRQHVRRISRTSLWIWVPWLVKQLPPIKKMVKNALPTRTASIPTDQT